MAVHALIEPVADLVVSASVYRQAAEPAVGQLVPLALSADHAQHAGVYLAENIRRHAQENKLFTSSVRRCLLKHWHSDYWLIQKGNNLLFRIQFWSVQPFVFLNLTTLLIRFQCQI